MSFLRLTQTVLQSPHVPLKEIGDIDFGLNVASQQRVPFWIALGILLGTIGLSLSVPTKYIQPLFCRRPAATKSAQPPDL
jgi:hypothetical protein